MNDKQLIQPYKLGAINTEQFLRNLLHIFPFSFSVSDPDGIEVEFTYHPPMWEQHV